MTRYFWFFSKKFCFFFFHVFVRIDAWSNHQSLPNYKTRKFHVTKQICPPPPNYLSASVLSVGPLYRLAFVVREGQPRFWAVQPLPQVSKIYTTVFPNLQARQWTKPRLNQNHHIDPNPIPNQTRKTTTYRIKFKNWCFTANLHSKLNLSLLYTNRLKAKSDQRNNRINEVKERRHPNILWYSRLSRASKSRGRSRPYGRLRFASALLLPSIFSRF